MKLHSPERSAGARRALGAPQALLLMALGLVTGAFLPEAVRVLRGSAASGGEFLVAPYERAAFLDPAPVPAPPADNRLRTLDVTLDADAAATLQAVRERALDRGIIIQDEADTVDAVLALDGEQSRAEVRIKGDWTDHVETDQWSLRVKLKDTKVLGMATFSIQAPQTRGFLWEWFILEAARRAGLLAPRGTFVNVRINGNGMGVYYLEEHFSKELLESQGRREGPIVLWDESTRWSSLLQAHNVPPKGVELPVPESSSGVWNADVAPVRAYGEKRLASIESLSRSLYSAVEQLRALQQQVVAADTFAERLRRLEALTEVQGRSVDALVDTDKLASMHALASLFQLEHPLVWHNMRFYHDPVLDRLEPILFDCNAHEPSSREVAIFRSWSVGANFGTSERYYDGVFEHLARYCAPGWIDGLLADVGEELGVYEAALAGAQVLTPDFSVASMVARLRTEQAYLRTVLEPVDPLNLHASYALDPGVEEGSDLVSGTATVLAWATTRSPVVVEGFRFGNGVVVPALAALAPGTARVVPTADAGVVLPRDGRSVEFRFSLDQRLANLQKVDQLLAAVQQGTEASPSIDLQVEALYRPLVSTEATAELLTLRRVQPLWEVEGGRPVPPTLEQALAAHEFLAFDRQTGVLSVLPGTWQVTGDLVVPSGLGLEAREAQLQFEPDALLLSEGPLRFTDVTLAPREGADRWRGVVVLQAGQRSEWERVTVRATDAVTRGGWTVTGGITFYRSPIRMLDCLIDGTWAEDGTNVFGTEFELVGTTFSACVSDSFDGDFVTGTLRGCTFVDGLADGVDVSGSDVLVADCRFLDMGDKGISAGEDSRVRVEGGLCDGVSIGIASKDRSEVTAAGMTIRAARNYALAVFIKKAEFGPSSLAATGLVIEGSGRGDTLVQTDCSLTVDGVAVATQDLDVKQLYEDKVLGQ